MCDRVALFYSHCLLVGESRSVSTLAPPCFKVDHVCTVPRRDQLPLVPSHELAPEVQALGAIVRRGDLAADDVVELRLHDVTVLSGFARPGGEHGSPGM